MNANELADELNKCIKDGSTDLVCVEQAATMLRQQQTEIETLKSDMRMLLKEYYEYCIKKK